MRTSRLIATGILGGGNLRYQTLPQYLLSNPGTVISDFENAADFNLVGTGATKVTDSTHFVTGSASVQVTTGAGNVAELIRNGTWNLATSYQNMVLSVYINDITKVSSLTAYITSNASYTLFMSSGIAGNTLRNGWNHVFLTENLWGASGGESWNNTMVQFKVRVTPVAGQVAVVSIDNFTAGLQSYPAVCFTFDDADASVYTRAYAYMAQQHLPGTFYVITDNVASGANVTWEQLQTMDAGGWLIGNHTKTHTSLTTLTQEQQEAELTGAKTALETNGLTRGSVHVSYPFGAVNEDTYAAMTNTGMLTGRLAGGSGTTFVSSIYPNLFRLPVRPLEATVSLATAKTYVDAAKMGRVQVFMGHIIKDGVPAGNEWNETDFRALVDYCIAQQVYLITPKQLYDAQSGPVSVRKPW